MSDLESSHDLERVYVQNGETQNTEAFGEVRGPRDPNPTVLEWQVQWHHNNFRNSVSAWQKCAKHLKTLLCDTRDVSVRRHECNELHEVMERVTKLPMVKWIPNPSWDRRGIHKIWSAGARLSTAGQISYRMCLWYCAKISKYEALNTVSHWVTDLHSMKRSPDLSFLALVTSPEFFF